MEGSLAGGVVRSDESADEGSSAGGEQDPSVATVHHVGQRSLREKERCGEIHRQGFLPGRQIDLGQRVDWGDAGVGQHQVEASEFIDDLCNNGWRDSRSATSNWRWCTRPGVVGF